MPFGMGRIGRKAQIFAISPTLCRDARIPVCALFDLRYPSACGIPERLATVPPPVRSKPPANVADHTFDLIEAVRPDPLNVRREHVVARDILRITKVQPQVPFR